MHTYQLRRGDETTGPYEEPQLIDLWEGGQLSGDIMAMHEPDGDWEPLYKLMAQIQDRHAKEAQQDRWRQQRLTYAAQSSSEFQKRRRNPLLAFLMSLVVPGSGHLYIGTSVLGVLWLAGVILTVAALLMNHAEVGTIVKSCAAWGILSGVFAYISAGRANQRLRSNLQI